MYILLTRISNVTFNSKLVLFDRLPLDVCNFYQKKYYKNIKILKSCITRHIKISISTSHMYLDFMHVIPWINRTYYIRNSTHRILRHNSSVNPYNCFTYFF